MKFWKINGILFVVLMVFMFSIPVMAQESKDTLMHNTIEIGQNSSNGENVLTPMESEQLGSITIRLEDTGTVLSKDNVEFSVIQVADVINGQFILKENFAATNVNLNEIQNANELELAAKKMAKCDYSAENIVVTDGTGIASVAGLSVGVYLITAVDIAEYENITPFLVSIPTFDELEDIMSYEVEVCPKHTPLPETEIPGIFPTGIDNMVFPYTTLSMIFLLLSGGLLVILKKKKKVF